MRVQEVAEYVGVSEGTIRRWTRAGHLCPRKTKLGKYIYDKQEVDAFVEAEDIRPREKQTNSEPAPITDKVETRSRIRRRVSVPGSEED